MIPENYWRILRRWYWLIAAVAIGTSLFAAVVVSQVMGSSSPGFSSATTLGVTRIVSFGGTVTVGGDGDPQLLASYTENIAGRGSTPQFVSNLQTRLAALGVITTEEQLSRKLDFKPVPGLFRIDIEAEAGTPEDAAIIASTAAQLMVEDVTAEETRIKTALRESSTLQQTELLNQLTIVYQARATRLQALGEPTLREGLDNLIRSGIGADLNSSFNTLVQDFARITSDSELAVLNSEAGSLEVQLAALAESQRGFSDEILLGNPVSVVNPVQTVPVPPVAGLRTRDLALMGLIAGSIFGWIAATMADGWTVGQRMDRARREEWETVSTVSSVERYFSND